MITDLNKGRIFAVLQFVLLCIVLLGAMLFHERDLKLMWLHYTGIAIAAAGLIFAVVAVLNYGQMVTPNPYPLEKAELRTTGIYSKIRHPMYFSVLIIICGWSIMFFSLVSVVFPFLAFGFLMIKIRFEEKRLMMKFPGYKEYMSKTYRLIPFIY